jgi:predicted permease
MANRIPSPPRWAEKLLRWRCPKNQLEEVEGDMLELFQQWVRSDGERKARRRYWLHTLTFLRPLPDRQSDFQRIDQGYTVQTFSIDMIRNYFTTAWRQLMRNKVYGFLNILGLATGMTVALTIGLWVHHQFSYDRFLPDYERLYQVRRNFNSNGDTLNFATTSLKLADALRNQIPEIEYVAESDWMGAHGLKAGDIKLYMSGAQIGSDFLRMFQYPLIQGKVDDVLKDPYSIVLTRSTAKALFGSENPVGKTVRFDNKDDLIVSGVLEDVPANSSFQFHYLVPFSYFEAREEYVKMARTGSFGNNSFQIFVKLKPGVTFEQIAHKIGPIEHTEKNSLNAINSYVVLQPLQKWHLYSEYENGKNTKGLIENVRMFSIIGALVLLIACINFVNLTTARSAKRAREVGVRKAIGSRRKQLIVQFLTESMLLTVIAFGISMIMAQMVLPSFNNLTGDLLTIPYTDSRFWILMLGFVLLTALLAGSRPAFYLSSFQPIRVLKGAIQVGRSASLPRQLLVITQFSCSIALIVSAIVIYQQIQHAQNRSRGYEVNRLMLTETNDDLERNYAALKNELMSKGITESVTMASSPATNIYSHSDVDNWPGKYPGETVEMGIIRTGDDYFKTMGMAMKEGRDFSSPNDTLNVIFNETAIKRLRLKAPISQIITFDDRQLRIVGVVIDALMLSPFASADPTMFLYEPNTMGHLLYRLSPRVQPQEALTQLTSIFTKYSPSYPYSYQFTDAAYAAKFNQEILIGKLAALFAGLAIFISCLGLFGLAAYVAEQRTKEIGIRKVLGASVPQIWLLLSKDFIFLVLISCLIASPMAWYFLQNWLQKYDYRVDLQWSVFIGSALAALLITVITISFQSIRAANANPVKSLRTE